MRKLRLQEEKRFAQSPQLTAAEPGVEPASLNTHPLPRAHRAFPVEVPSAELRLLPRAGVLASLGIQSSLAVWQGSKEVAGSRFSPCRA